MNKAIGFLYYVHKENGIQTVDIIAETETHLVIEYERNIWIIKKSEVSDKIIEGHLYTYSYSVAKQILTRFVDREVKKIEMFRKQLLKD